VQFASIANCCQVHLNSKSTDGPGVDCAVLFM
jgi:hypothetical protein